MSRNTSHGTSRPTRISPARRSGSSMPASLFPEFRDAERWRTAGAAHARRTGRPANHRRRHLLRAVDVLPALHLRHLPAFSPARRPSSDRCARAHARASAADGGCARGAAGSRRHGARDWRCRRRSADAVGGTRAPRIVAASLPPRPRCLAGATSRRPRAGRRQRSFGCSAPAVRTPLPRPPTAGRRRRDRGSSSRAVMR